MEQPCGCEDGAFLVCCAAILYLVIYANGCDFYRAPVMKVRSLAYMKMGCDATWIGRITTNKRTVTIGPGEDQTS